MTATPAPNTAAAPPPRKYVPLKDLGVAPENMRFGEPADDGVPLLADTIHAAGLLKPLHVRPGRRKEKPVVALDGRRRLFALEHNRELGRIGDDHLVEVVEVTAPERQAAAVLLTNTAVPVHVADVIASIGKMLKAKLTVPSMARALGYAEAEIKRLAALSAVHPKALEALKQGRMTLSQARLLARLPDRELQKDVAVQALAGLGFQGWRISERMEQGRVTALDRRFALVGGSRYTESGGRLEADLFGELPDQLLDPEILGDLWTARVRAAAAPLEAEGVAVHITLDGEAELPDGLEPLGYVYANALPAEQLAAYEEARTAFGEVAHQVREADLAAQDGPERIASMLRAKLALERAGQPGRTIQAVVLWPAGRLGADSRFYAEPAPDTDEPPEAGGAAIGGHGVAAHQRQELVEVPLLEVDLEGIGHAVHETLTHTRRSEEQVAMDQFSTPPPLAALAVLAAQIRPGDKVLEPSAGTGLLAVVAETCGAELHLNELSAHRAALLDGLFPGAGRTRHDAALLADLLPLSGAVDAVVCNPPFSALQAHLLAALACIADGGRMAAIVPVRAFSDRGMMAAVASRGAVVAQLAFPQRAYAKHGTSVETGLLVVDRRAQAAASGRAPPDRPRAPAARRRPGSRAGSPPWRRHRAPARPAAGSAAPAPPCPGATPSWSRGSSDPRRRRWPARGTRPGRSRRRIPRPAN